MQQGYRQVFCFAELPEGGKSKATATWKLTFWSFDPPVKGPRLKNSATSGTVGPSQGKKFTKLGTSSPDGQLIHSGSEKKNAEVITFICSFATDVEKAQQN